MYKVTTTKGEEFDIKFENDGFSVNGKTREWDIRKIQENLFHILYEGKSFLSLLLISFFVVSINSGCGIFHKGDKDDYEYTDENSYDSSYSSEDETIKEETSLGEYHPSHTIVNDIISTTLEVSFDWEHQHMDGKATITFRPHFYPTDTLTLDAKGFDIHKVEFVPSTLTKLKNPLVANTPLQFVYDSSQLHIFLDKVYTRDDMYTIFIDYTAKPNERKTEGSAAITGAKGLYFINPRGEDKDKPVQIWTQGETEANSVRVPSVFFFWLFNNPLLSVTYFAGTVM